MTEESGRFAAQRSRRTELAPLVRGPKESLERPLMRLDAVISLALKDGNDVRLVAPTDSNRV